MYNFSTVDPLIIFPPMKEYQSNNVFSTLYQCSKFMNLNIPDEYNQDGDLLIVSRASRILEREKYTFGSLLK